VTNKKKTVVNKSLKKKNSIKKKKKLGFGFTLIELLAVIVILGLLLAIAIPSVTRYINQSKKKTLVTSINSYIDALITEVNDMNYSFTGANTIYAVPIECIALERGGTNPFGEWMMANNDYWAYVLVQYDEENSTYIYGFTFKDSTDYGLYPLAQKNLEDKGSQINTGLSLYKPNTGSYIALSDEIDFWNTSGFKVNDETNLKVLRSTLEDQIGDGKNTCTLAQKGNNYDEIVEERSKVGTLINVGIDSNNVFGKSMERSAIESIITLDYIPSEVSAWDASSEGNGLVKAWTKDEDNDGLYELYLGQEGGVVASSSCFGLFYDYTNLTSINLDNLDTSNTRDMQSMFNNVNKLENLNVNIDTSKVTNMQYMFNRMDSLKNITFGTNFKTNNVIAMSFMFANCKSLKTLNLSKFTTTNVINMFKMFFECSSLETINLSNFTTTNVTDMSYMFYNNNMLQSLNINHFDTSNVTDMSYMFYNLKEITSLNLSNIKTTKLKKANRMFYYMSSLSTLKLNSADFSKTKETEEMFRHLNSLTSIEVSNSNKTFVEKQLNKDGVTANIIT